MKYNRRQYYLETIKLQTFAACYSRHTAWLASNIKNNRPLNPWDKEMCALTSGQLLYSSKSIEDNSSMTTINCAHQYNKL